MKGFRLLLPIICFTLLFSGSYAYNIVGNSVVEETSDWKIVVTPHTCYSPVGDCEQIVEITNKTGSPETLDITSSFPKASISQIAQQKTIPPTYSTTEKSFVCKDDVVSVSNTTKCQKTVIDLNGAKSTTILFNNPKAVFDSKTNTFTWEEQTLTKPTTYSAKTIITTAKSATTDYKISDTIVDTVKYKLDYKANTVSGKWSLKLSNGLEIDPWWDNTYAFKKQITITIQDNNWQDLNTTIDINLDTSALISAGKMRSDCKDLEIVYKQTTQKDRNIIACNTTTTHVKFRPDYNIGTTDTNYEMYYGKASDTADKNNAKNVFAVWADFDDGTTQDFNTTVLCTDWTIENQRLKIIGTSECYAEYDIEDYSNLFAKIGYNFWFSPLPSGYAYAGVKLVSARKQTGTDRFGWFARWNITNFESGVYGIKYNGKQTAWSITPDFNGVNLLDANTIGMATYKIGEEQYLTGADINGIKGAKFLQIATEGQIGAAYFDNIYLEKTTQQKPIISLGIEETIGYIIADANHTTPTVLDQDNGVTSVSTTLTNLTNYSNKVPKDINWYKNGVFYADGNSILMTFTVAGDYNVSLITNTTDGNISQKDQNISVYNLPQGIVITVTNLADTNADINLQFTATTSTSGTLTYNWLLHDTNSALATPTKKFTTSGNKNICVTLTISDVNKTSCSTIIVGKAKVAVPKNEQSPNPLVFPYNILLDTNSTSAISDTNGIEALYDWRYSTETKSHTIIIDINSDYFQASYGWEIQPLDYNIQPYVLKQSVAGSVRFHTKEAISGSTLSNVKITIKKIIGTMTTVGEQYTDTSGTATFYMVFNDSYYIDVEYQGKGFSNWLLKPVTGDYTITIGNSGTSGSDLNYITVHKFVLTYSPNTNDYNTATAFNVTTTSVLGSDIKSIQTLVYRDENTLIYTYNYNEGGTLFTTHSQATAAITGTRTGETLRIRTIITDANDRNYYYYKTWSWNTSTNKPIEKIQSIAGDFGSTGGAIIGLFLTLFIVGLAVYGGLGSRGVFVVGGMCFLVFGFLGFFPLALSIIVCVVGFFAAYLMGGY